MADLEMDVRPLEGKRDHDTQHTQAESTLTRARGVSRNSSLEDGTDFAYAGISESTESHEPIVGGSLRR